MKLTDTIFEAVSDLFTKKEREKLNETISDSAKKKAIEKFKKERPEATDDNIKYYVDKFSDKQNSNVFKKKDIFQYTFDELERIIDANFPTASTISNDNNDDFSKSEDVIYNQNGLLILLGDLKEKCIRYGKGESWCISRNDNRNMFYSYRMRINEPVFYFVFDENKPKEDKYSKIVVYVNNRKEYYVTNKDNKGDKNMDWSEIEQIQPKLKGLEKLFKHIPLSDDEKKDYEKFKNRISDEQYFELMDIEKEKYIKFGHILSEKQIRNTPRKLISLYAVTSMGANIPEDIEQQLSPSDREKMNTNRLEAVKRDGLSIRHIQNPPEQVQLEAVKQNSEAIEYIQNPSEQAQLESVKRDGSSIQHIENPSEQVQLEAVKQDGNAIQHIENRSEQVQLEAVKQAGLSIQHIENPSEQVQLEAVKQNSEAIEYIQNPSEQVQLEVVKRDGLLIRWIENPSEQVQLEAVKRHGWSIGSIENPSEQVQLVAVKQNGSSIRWIENPSEQVQLEAVKQDGDAIQHIENPSEQVQIEAVKRDGLSIRHIQNPSEQVQLIAKRFRELAKRFRELSNSNLR